MSQNSQAWWVSKLVCEKRNISWKKKVTWISLGNNINRIQFSLSFCPNPTICWTFLAQFSSPMTLCLQSFQLSHQRHFILPCPVVPFLNWALLLLMALVLLHLSLNYAWSLSEIIVAESEYFITLSKCFMPTYKVKLIGRTGKLRCLQHLVLKHRDDSRLSHFSAMFFTPPSELIGVRGNLFIPSLTYYS